MWTTVFDSVTGVSHMRSGAPCQDSCRVVESHFGDESLLVSICSDGAGSASHADIGSQYSCDYTLECIENWFNGSRQLSEFDKDDVLQIMVDLRTQLAFKAEELAVTVRELACTLLCAIIGDDEAVFWQIGDGAIVVQESDCFQAVFWPQSGEYANTTNFVSQEDSEHVTEFQRITCRVERLAMFTDGLERMILKFEDKTVHSPFFVPMFNALETATAEDDFFASLRTFLDSEKVNERTDDDKTLVLATRRKLVSDAPNS